MIRYWRKRSQKHTIPITPNVKYPVKIHTACAINFNGLSKVRFYLKRKKMNKNKEVKYQHLSMNSDSTILTFRHMLKPFLSETEMQDYPILMDNASCHGSILVKGYLEEEKINVLEFPASSPDLNPIEQVFSIWSKKVARRCPSSVENLKEICEEEWENIDLEIVRKMIQKLKKTVKWVKDHNGEMCYE